VRRAIEYAVPVGFDQHKHPVAGAALSTLQQDFERIRQRAPQIDKRIKHAAEKFACQLGTLGGGNHFIELCLDEAERVWVMLHSGSRGIGNAIGSHYIETAKRDMQQHIANLPDRDLAYLSEGTRHYDDYVFAVDWAQRYARANRDVMMSQILQALTEELPPFQVTEEAINCHHNYVANEQHFGQQVHLTRKGAIRAGKGELGIIPGSMGTPSYIVRGKGGADAFDSCAHGAGRRMSRTQAKKQFSVEDLKAQTKGVECRKDKGVLDEIPGAYKDIDSVMENQSDLVEVVHRLKQVVTVKG
jgi:tRNA-splicing ligase RtcB